MPGPVVAQCKVVNVPVLVSFILGVTNYIPPNRVGAFHLLHAVSLFQCL